MDEGQQHGQIGCAGGVLPLGRWGGCRPWELRYGARGLRHGVRWCGMLGRGEVQGERCRYRGKEGEKNREKGDDGISLD